MPVLPTNTSLGSSDGVALMPNLRERRRAHATASRRLSNGCSYWRPLARIHGTIVHVVAATEVARDLLGEPSCRQAACSAATSSMPMRCLYQR